MAPPTSHYHHLTTRYDSLTSTSIPNSRKKVKAVAPHVAGHLAQNGFYRTGATDLKCFSCDHELDCANFPDLIDLHSEDDDLSEDVVTSLHLSASPICPWATIRSTTWVPTASELGSKKYKILPKKSWDEKWGESYEFHPRGPVMEAARRGTFAKGRGWPARKDKGWTELIEKIIAAGWYYRPGDSPSDVDEIDQCSCLYCGKIVSGWAVDDDPIADHQRNVGLNCPFFLAADPPAQPEIEAPPTAESSKRSTKSTGSKRTGSKAKAIEDVAVDEPEEEHDPAPEPGPASSPRKTKPKSTRGTKKSTIEPIAEVAATTSNRTRSRAGSVTHSIDGGGRSTRGTRGKTADTELEEDAVEELVEEENEEDEEDEAAVPKQASKKGKGKKSTKRAPTPAASVEPSPAPSSPAPSSKSKPKKSTASRRGTRAATAVIEEEEPAAVEPAPIEEEVEPEEEREDDLMEPEAEPVRVSEPVVADAPAPKKSKKGGNKAKPAPEPEPEPEPELAEEAEEMQVEEEQVEAAPEPEPALVQVVEPPPTTKPKKSKKAAAPKIPTQMPVVSTPTQPTTPQTSHVASPSPRLIRSLPSKVNPTSNSKPTLTPLALSNINSHPTSFPPAFLPSPITEDELNMNLGEYYDYVGKKVYSQLKEELMKVDEEFVKKIEQGRMAIDDLIRRKREGMSRRGEKV